MKPFLILFLLMLLPALTGEDAAADPALESAKAAERKIVDGAKAAKDKAVETAEKKFADEVAKATTQLKVAYQAAIKKAMSKGDLATANLLKMNSAACTSAA